MRIALFALFLQGSHNCLPVWLPSTSNFQVPARFVHNMTPPTLPRAALSSPSLFTNNISSNPDPRNSPSQSTCPPSHESFEQTAATPPKTCLTPTTNAESPTHPACQRSQQQKQALQRAVRRKALLAMLLLMLLSTALLVLPPAAATTVTSSLDLDLNLMGLRNGGTTALTESFRSVKQTRLLPNLDSTLVALRLLRL